MKLANIFRNALKPVAIIKYLFFPFMMANAAPVEVTCFVGAGETITAQTETPTTIWVGTSNGLYRINKNNHAVTHLTAANSVLPANHIIALCTTPSGDVFAATGKGLFHFDGYSYLALTSENCKLPAFGITALGCDAAGYLWVGTSTKGLLMMHGFKTWAFTPANSVVTDNKVVAITTDARKNMLVQFGDNSVVLIDDSGLHKPQVETQGNELAREN